jgi:hypothetical protein
MYTQPIDRNHPGCIAMLLDQSASMSDPFAAGSTTKADALATAVNSLLRNLVLQCQKGEDIRDYFHVALIGYGSKVGSIFGGDLRGHELVPISAVADYPLRMATDYLLPDRQDLSVSMPVWVDAVAEGATPMAGAIDLAGALLASWANDHFESFPPIVINVSDGAATDADPRPLAAQLRDLRTRDGSLLMFNVNLSSSATPPIQYANSPHNLPDAYARTLFEMSSELTPFMVAVARGMGLSPSDGARGFVFNADMSALSELLDVGTRVATVADR